MVLIVRALPMQGVHQRPHPYGDKYIFAYIALATYKLVTKTESNTYPSIIACNSPRKLAIESLSISNYVVPMYKHLIEVFIETYS